jgi:serine phosphatase RsbU (regulator of sigma subunit)/putative methionine-R-sulfoxide reductase with GAF domain
MPEAPPPPISLLNSHPWVGMSGALVLLSAFWAVCQYLAQRRHRRHARQQLGALSALSQSLLSTHLDQGQICTLIYHQVTDLRSAPTFVLQLAQGRGITVPIAALNDRLIDVEGQAVGRGAWDWLRTTLHPLVVDDLEPHTAFEPLHLGPPARSGLYVPIVAEGELLGVISLQSPAPHAFQTRDLEALSLLSAQSALGIYTAQLYQQQKERAAQLEMISTVSRKVAAILDLQTLFADTVRLVHDTLGYYHVGIYSVSAEQQLIALEASSSPMAPGKEASIPWGKGLIGTAVLNGESLMVNDVRQDSRYRTNTLLEKTRSELVIPLKVERRILGVLDLQSDQLGAFDLEDASVLGILADQIAVAIEDSRLYQAQQEQAWISTALLQVAEGVAQHSTPEGITETVVRLTQLLTGVDRCLALLWADADSPWNQVTGAGYGQEQLAALRDPRLTSQTIAILEQVAQGRTAQTEAQALHQHLPADPQVAANTDGELCAFPLWADGRVIGGLIVEDHRRGRMVGPRLTILAGIANQATLAIQNARLHAAQREESWVSTALLQVATVAGNTTYDLDETLATVVRLGPMLVGVRWCVILLWDEQQQLFTGGASHGLIKSLAQAIHRAPFRPDQVPLLRQLMQRSDPLTVAVAPLCDNGEPHPLLRDLSAMIALPLRAHERFLGALLAGLPEAGAVISGRRMNILSGIANQTSLAIETAQLYEQTVQQQRLQHEIELARAIQQSFLPECCPLIQGWEIGIEWRAARGVGGDFYDLIDLEDGRLGLVIADVSDKGVGAALYMALSKTVMRTVALGTRSPALALQRANRILLEDSRSGMFVTLFYGILDLDRGEMTYARAGHNPPLLIRRDQQIELLDPPGIVLGILDPVHFEERRVALAPGDTLLLYTDGVTEAINDQEQEFGEERLAQALRAGRHLDAEAQVVYIDQQVRAFTGDVPQFDDFTLMVVKRED